MKDQSASGILATAIDKIKDMVDCQTIIGDPIDAGDGIKVIPISKVTYGFASGGSDFPTKTSKELSVKYICEGSESSAERIIGMVPDVVNKVGDIINKFSKDGKEDETDSVFVEE